MLINTHEIFCQAGFTTKYIKVKFRFSIKMVYVCKYCGRAAEVAELCCEEEMVMDEYALDIEDDDV